ncbi:unnamed protein product [Paramecium octaurelia]|uniref:Iron-binding zinc finger CDGSH type domain-containing protein n=1 Tax=Paramecium octaurelia TaxID=43137 RepID=A0A8S1T6P3_PAROT|nr:unnamed protein product [Paramecium octaurelia]
MQNQDKQKVIETGTSKVAARFPFTVFLEEGIEYYYCTCGLGSTQPFCDGQCEGTGFEPVKIIPKRSGNALLCGCKRQCDPRNPNCDGSHSVVNLDW